MATALRNPEISIVPIADINLASLEKLFDEECAEWLNLLKWDYKGASTLIRDVARQRQLSGFAAMRGSTALGFAYYVIEGWRCSIGDIYVSKRWRRLGLDRELAKAILDQLDLFRRLRRIESQYVGLENNEADTMFQSRGFERLERSYMIADLRSTIPTTVRTDLPDISIRQWQPGDFDQAAKVIHRSYRGKHDSRINSQYQNLQGCAELLTILTDHFWCGDFLPQMSLVAARSSGALAGVLIASRVAPGVGHLGQISVHPGQQGRGIGRRMIEKALHQYGLEGYESVSLAVTTANANAFHLYQSCGFRTAHTFPVFYREKK
ncbi:MAG TPA: GNAT family N-acetyltransferase [Blastocatellia bacterium]|nr:GNAT family N-acetyltransferase [Blastocatellia bacterium]